MLDATAKPVAGAQLIVRYTDGLAEAVMLASFVGGTTMTGADGTFAIAGLVPNAPVTLRAEYAEQRTNAVTIEIGPGQSEADVVLRRP